MIVSFLRGKHLGIKVPKRGKDVLGSMIVQNCRKCFLDINHAVNKTALTSNSYLYEI